MSSAEQSAMITKNEVARQLGWSRKRIQRDLGDPDETRHEAGGVVKLYALERVEAAKSNAPTPPSRGQTPKRRKTRPKKRPQNTRSKGMTSDHEDALAGSMLAQYKDGISDNELMETTWSAAALRRRGWTDTLVRDLLGEPHWLAPNPKYPNAGAPMKLWHRDSVEQLERTAIWQKRRSRRHGLDRPTPEGSPMDDLALVQGWRSPNGDVWCLLGAPQYPRVLASARGKRCWLMILPPTAGPLMHLWDADAYAEMTERVTGESPYLQPVGDAYEKCSNCGCPLAHSNEMFNCPSCGALMSSIALDDATKMLRIVVINPTNEQALASAARAITSDFLDLHSRQWLQNDR